MRGEPLPVQFGCGTVMKVIEADVTGSESLRTFGLAFGPSQLRVPIDAPDPAEVQCLIRRGVIEPWECRQVGERGEPLTQVMTLPEAVFNTLATLLTRTIGSTLASQSRETR